MKKGFTLVELLVVIAIIGVLAAAVLVSLAGTRPKARDARRLSDLQNVSRAIQLFSDANTTVEEGVPHAVAGQAANYSTTLAAASNGIGTIAPTYMQSLPSDPSGTAATIQYGYLSFQSDGITESTTTANAKRYRLGAWAEVASVSYDLSVDTQPANEMRVSQ